MLCRVRIFYKSDNGHVCVYAHTCAHAFACMCCSKYRIVSFLKFFKFTLLLHFELSHILTVTGFHEIHIILIMYAIKVTYFTSFRIVLH